MKEGQAVIILSLTKEEFRDTIIECLTSINNESHPSHYSKREFAELIGKSTSWVDEMRRQGNLEWYKLGGTISIPHSEYLRLTGK